MRVAEAPFSISITLRVAMVRASAFGGEEEQFNRRVGGAGNFQARAIGGEGGIHGDDGFIQLHARMLTLSFFSCESSAE